MTLEVCRMRKLKVAVSGLGRIGWEFHMPAITRHEGFELAAVADPMPERIEEAYRQYGVKGYANYKELLENEKIDLMVVASPTIFHAEQSLAAFAQGVDVFLEKPMAPSLEEADIIIEGMKKHNRKLMVYQPERATSESQALKNVIEKGLIGSIYMIKRTRTGYSRRDDWQSLKQFGGGMLNNYGAHQIDQLLNLAGSPARRVSCSLRRIASLGDADDVVKAVIEAENGILLDLDINMATAFEFPKWYILGSLGTITFTWEGSDHGVFTARYLLEKELPKAAVNSGLAAEGRAYGGTEGLIWHEETFEVSKYEKINYYDKCYAYYALGEKPFVPVAETREVMRVINECRKDAGW